MKVEAFTLRFAGGKSFYARVEGREIAVVDAFCVLESDPLPVCVGMCTVALKLRFERAEAGTKRVGISFLDEAGKVARPGLEATVEVKAAGDKEMVEVPFAFLIKQLSMPAFGEYSVELAVDGKVKGAAPLYVRQKG